MVFKLYFAKTKSVYISLIFFNNLQTIYLQMVLISASNKANRAFKNIERNLYPYKNYQ